MKVKTRTKRILKLKSVPKSKYIRDVQKNIVIKTCSKTKPKLLVEI